MNPPDQNPTYIKVSDQGGYLAVIDSQFFTVEALQIEIANLQATIDARATTLKGLAAVGVADAITSIDLLTAQPLSSILAGVPSVGAVIDQQIKPIPDPVIPITP